MRTNSKEVREKVRQHILDSVYDENENKFDNIDLANEYLASEFKRVADYPNNLQRIPNHQDRFEDYLKGIPFHFEYMDYKIEEFLNGLGINPQGKEYSSDEMWKLYSYLIWREASRKYHNYKKGGNVRSTASWNRDRLWTSNEPHEQAYKSKRKSAVRRHGVDSERASQEPHEVATRSKKYLTGGDLDHVMFIAGGSIENHMGASDLEEFAKGGNVESKPRLKRGDKVFMICRRWFQQTYGNTYHSTDVYVNGDLVAQVPFEYGYGDHCVDTGLRELFKVYKAPYKWEGQRPSRLKDYGIKFTSEIIDVTRKKDLELGGLIDDLKPERDLIVPFKRGGKLEKKKLDDAIKHFEEKIKAQGHVTNARDEEHLESLKKVRSEMNGYAKGGEIMSKLTAGDFISENEMKLITRRMNNDKLDDEMREVIQYIWDNDVAIDPNSDWSEKGLKFLLNQYKSPTGKVRVSNPFGYREIDILENFGHFELAGFYDISRYGGVSYFVPLYDVCDKDGFCFQYYYDGKVHIVGMFGGLFGAEKSYNRSWHTDRMWTSKEAHEQAYKPKRKSAIRNNAKDRRLDSQEPHEIATRKKMESGGKIDTDALKYYKNQLNRIFTSGEFAPSIVFTSSTKGLGEDIIGTKHMDLNVESARTIVSWLQGEVPIDNYYSRELKRIFTDGKYPPSFKVIGSVDGAGEQTESTKTMDLNKESRSALASWLVNSWLK